MQYINKNSENHQENVADLDKSTVLVDAKPNNEPANNAGDLLLTHDDNSKTEDEKDFFLEDIHMSQQEDIIEGVKVRRTYFINKNNTSS